MRRVLTLSIQGQLGIFLSCYLSKRLLKESQELEESKNLLSQKIRYWLDNLQEMKSLKGCRGYSAWSGGQSKDAGERCEGEEDHNQHWQEQVSSVESYFQVWHEDQVRQEGIALQLNFSFVFIISNKKQAFIRYFTSDHGGRQQATRDAEYRWNLTNNQSIVTQLLFKPWG